MQFRFKNSVVESTQHIYKVIHKVKTYTVYELYQTEEGKQSKYPRLVRIEKYRGKSNARGIESYFRIRDKDNWAKCTQITGLRYYQNGIYYGDDNRTQKSLLVFHLSEDKQALTIHHFNAFYPFNLSLLTQLLNEVIKTL